MNMILATGRQPPSAMCTTTCSRICPGTQHRSLPPRPLTIAGLSSAAPSPSAPALSLAPATRPGSAGWRAGHGLTVHHRHGACFLIPPLPRHPRQSTPTVCLAGNLRIQAAAQQLVSSASFAHPRPLIAAPLAHCSPSVRPTPPLASPSACVLALPMLHPRQEHTFHLSSSSCFVLYWLTSSSSTFRSPCWFVVSAGTTSLTVLSTSTPLMRRKHLRSSGKGASVSSTSLSKQIGIGQ